ncbi:SagB/ThcOx family dehydrogenase [Patescibacteria group bacterium]|nr:SagB/ThcOx family dehydrogenase [Patescibacteria group bacterium]
MKIKTDLNELLGKSFSLSEEFHQKTKLKKISDDHTFNKVPKEWKTVQFKSYPRFKELVLPKPKIIDPSLKKILIERKSSRNFSRHPLSLEKLSGLLYYSAGLKTYKEPWLVNRFYPSAGSRYPLEVYLISLNSQLPMGLYHYYLKNHSLEKIQSFDRFKASNYFRPDWVEKSSVIIIITAVFKRNTIKYGDRGYRHILIEAGHLGQNLYLMASVFKLSCCAMGGYYDDRLNELIDIDGHSESVIYTLALGQF